MMQRPMVVNIQLVDGQGMIVRYSEPVRRLIQPRPLGRDARMVETFFNSIIAGLEQAKDESTTEGSKQRLAGVLKGIQQGLDAVKPKPTEKYVLEVRTSVCRTSEELMAVIEKATECKRKIEELESRGELAFGGGCFPAYGDTDETFGLRPPVIGRPAVLPGDDVAEIF